MSQSSSDSVEDFMFCLLGEDSSVGILLPEPEVDNLCWGDTGSLEDDGILVIGGLIMVALELDLAE